MTRFKQSLLEAQFTRPSEKVLSRIATSFSHRLGAVFDDVNASVDLYVAVKEMPDSTTMAAIRGATGIVVDGAFVAGRENLLLARDNRTGRSLIVKLLQHVQLSRTVPTAVLNAAIDTELNLSQEITDRNLECLVHARKVEVEVGEGESRRLWRGLVMTLFSSVLVNQPGGWSTGLLVRGFQRIQRGISHLHMMGFVHMDVKSDNIFIDVEGQWYLGDFGSATRIGETVLTFTEVFQPFHLNVVCTAVESFDWVLLCVAAAFELTKPSWKARLCGDAMHVSPAMVRDVIASCPDVASLLLPLWDEHSKILRDHVSQFGSTLWNE